MKELLRQSERPLPEFIHSLLDQQWPDAVHFRLLYQISKLLPPMCYRRTGQKATNLGALRPDFEAYLVHMLSYPSLSRQVQAMVILADGQFRGALGAIAGLLTDQREFKTTDWDDIPDSLHLEHAPDYPWRTQVCHIARDAMAELDGPLSFELGWLERPYCDHDELYTLILRTLTEPQAYPRCRQFLNTRWETHPEVRLLSLICRESLLACDILPESTWLPFLSETSSPLVWLLATHLQARHQSQPLSQAFCLKLLDAAHGLLQGLGLWLLAAVGWPGAGALAQAWLAEPLAQGNAETLFMGERYIEVLASEAERQRWAILVLGFVPGEVTRMTLLSLLRPDQPDEVQLAAAESFMRLQATQDLERLMQQLIETFEELNSCEHAATGEFWVPQLKILETLGDQSLLPRLVPLLPVDPSKPHCSDVTAALIGVLRTWRVDASHPLIASLCERQFAALDSLEPIGSKYEVCPGRHAVVDFLANVCTRAQIKQLLPHLVTDSLQLTPKHQRSHSLETCLARLLEPEDLPSLEAVLQPQNALTGQILAGLRRAALPGVAELVQRLLERDHWPANLRRRLNQMLSTQ